MHTANEHYKQVKATLDEIDIPYTICEQNHFIEGADMSQHYRKVHLTGHYTMTVVVPKGTDEGILSQHDLRLTHNRKHFDATESNADYQTVDVYIFNSYDNP